MTRDEVIAAAYGHPIPSSEWNSLVSEMNRETRSFADVLATETGLEVREAYYFFLVRMGTGYDAYPFNWEPFRDFAGPLLRHRSSIPIVLASSKAGPSRPLVQQVGLPQPHYRIDISPNCAVTDIANVWLETLADDHAIPVEGGEDFYSWFFGQLKIDQKGLTSKASRLVNSFPNRRA